ncbi:hypothetical protein CO178_00755, partial [candidate division WWE3 bacterium CG_4_9_14_3_um_filter_34_6]
EQLKEASETARQDDAVDIIKLANKTMKTRDYSFKKHFLKNLEGQIKSPYFARIDFTMKDFKNEITMYIGKHSYLPKTSKLKITDWRSPIASLFYNYQEPTKNAQYEFDIPQKHRPWIIDHRIIKGDLNLRRTIEIVEGEISGIYDNNLRVDLLSDAIKNKTGGILEDIIKTIQSGQNEIIRENPFNVTIVQGTAGSGKTTIAIHRISYLFYAHKKEINENNTLLLSSSKVLVNYVAKTLPELEIYSLDRNTLAGFMIEAILANSLEFAKIAHTSKYNNNINPSDVNSIIDKIASFANRLKEQTHKEFQSKSYYETLSINKYFNRMQNKPIYYQLKSIKENFEEEIAELKDGNEKGNIIIDNKINELKLAIKDINTIIKKFSVIKAYDDFRGFTKFDKNSIDIDELCIIYLITDAVYGLDGKKYKHIVVDEGQDLNLLNYKVIESLSDNGGFTILGDLNQATNAKNAHSIKKWDELSEIFAKSKISHHEIKTSYRNTKQITKFASSILQKFPEHIHLPEPFRREGENPEIKTFTDRNNIIYEIVNKISQINSDNAPKSIAIIETDFDQFDTTAHLLKSYNVNYIKVDELFEDFTQSGIYLVPEHLVKGLEFDTAFIIDPNEKLFPFNPNSAKRLFVCCTRP